MNYRHIYHAGNFADVVKHLALCLCLDRLKEKDAPFFVLDAHGGCGLYDLNSEEAQKTKEYEGGIGNLIRHCEEAKPTKQSSLSSDDSGLLRSARNDINLYLSLVKKDWEQKKYPGSPLLIARMLRPQDRMIANELHHDDHKTLKKTLQRFKNIRVEKSDAYQALRANVPPKERRGLVLIDPPFEKTDEFETLIKQMKEWKKRWETGSYLIWYPVKPHLPIAEFYKAAQSMGWKEVWIHEYESGEAFDPARPNKLLKCGIMLLNPPYQVRERLLKIMPAAACSQ